MKNVHPKIGIRPIIDGRRGGIRESLEEMTMTLARSVASLYASELRYADGAPVECVIADTTIGGVEEAALAAEKFKLEGVGAVISVTPCWCYGAETIDMDPFMPKAIWGFNGTERPGAVYLASALAGHNQKGLPAFGIYGSEVQDLTDAGVIPDDVREKLLLFGRAAVAVMQMRGKSYLSIGSVSMGIAGSIPDPDFFQEYLGMRNEYVDCSEIQRRIELGIYDHDEYARAMAWVEKWCKPREGADLNPQHLHFSREEKDKVWEFAVKMTMIFRDLMIGNPKLAEMGFKEEAMGHNAIAGGFQGQRQWTDFRPDGDFSEAILNSSFDWNGIREAFVFATENDTLNGVSMLFMHLLTNRAQLFSDVRTYWSPESVERVTGKKLEGKAANGVIHLINSGSSTLDATGEASYDGIPAMKHFWELTEDDVAVCLGATTWHPAGREYMRGGGFTSKFLTKGDMPVTMCRLNLVKGLGPVLQLAEGWAVNVDKGAYEKIDRRTDPAWPTTWFAPRLTDDGHFRSVYSVMNAWGANHGAISWGHVGAELMTLASMLRIPVCMHNVPQERIFRPGAWNAFGSDPEGADFRACRNYGPVYR